MIAVTLSASGRRTPAAVAAAPAAPLQTLMGGPGSLAGAGGDIFADAATAVTAAVAASVEAAAASPSEVFITDGTSFTIDSGMLIIHDKDEQSIAVFGSGTWLYATPGVVSTQEEV